MIAVAEMPPSTARRVRTGNHLAFDLADDVFALDAARVRDVAGPVEILPVPGKPAFFRGITNFWGSVVPIMDLRLKLDRPPAGDEREYTIMVVVAHGLDMGLLVDRVGGLFHVSDHRVRELPAFGLLARPDLAHGVVPCGDRSAILLDLDRLLHPDEWTSVPQP